MRKTLPPGPSDHRPFLCDFTFREEEGSRFRAALWNTHHSSSWREVADDFDVILNYEPSLLLLQEVKEGQKILQGLSRRYGLRYRHGDPEFGIAWDPKVWEIRGSHTLLMSPVSYWTTNRALAALLQHRKTGQLLRAFSGHPPAHVVREDHPSWPKVYAVHEDYARKTARMAARAQRNGIAFLGGEDLNVDPRKDRPIDGRQGWEWLFPPPLSWVRAPDPTHGRRHIDGYRHNRLLLPL